MKKYEVSADFLNALLAYLGAKPYLEVHEFIQYIRSEAQIKEEVDTDGV